MGKIIDVKKIIEKKKVELKEEVENLNRKNIFPKLALILANDDDASRVYVKNKRKLCEFVGIQEEEYTFDSSITTEKLLDIIEKLNIDDSVDGILVQLPLYKHLDETKILDSINPSKDVDGFHPLNLGRLMTCEDTILPCTPKGVMTILDSIDIDLTSKNAVVVGRSKIVGRPMAQLLLNKDLTVTVCHSKTKDLASYTKNADILVVAAGVPHIITEEMVKKDAIVIDVGINRVDGKIVGDVDTKGVLEKVSYVTSVPGGVGLTTVVSLIENIIEMVKKNKLK